MTVHTESGGSSAPVATTAPMQNGSSKAKRHEEYQYLDLVQDILDNGEHRPDR